MINKAEKLKELSRMRRKTYKLSKDVELRKFETKVTDLNDLMSEQVTKKLVMQNLTHEVRNKVAVLYSEHRVNIMNQVRHTFTDSIGFSFEIVVLDKIEPITFYIDLEPTKSVYKRKTVLSYSLASQNKVLVEFTKSELEVFDSLDFEIKDVYPNNMKQDIGDWV